MTVHRTTDIGDRVFELRTAAGWTQKELADYAGMSHVTVVSIETGQQTDPRLATLRKLASAFNMTVEEMVSPKVRPRPPAAAWLEERAGTDYLSRRSEELLPLVAGLKTLEDVEDVHADVQLEYEIISRALAEEDLEPRLRPSLETAWRNYIPMLKDLGQQRKRIRQPAAHGAGTVLDVAPASEGNQALNEAVEESNQALNEVAEESNQAATVELEDAKRYAKES